MSDLFRSAFAIVAHTPAWVWLLYALLLFLGLQRTRDGAISMRRMLILPIVVACLAAASVVTSGLSALPVALVGLVAGGTTGWFIERQGSTYRLPDGKIWLRGEWWSFIQLVLVLLFRYCTSAASVMNPGLSANPLWQLATVCAAAALSASFIGRTAARVRTYLTSTPITPSHSASTSSAAEQSQAALPGR